MTETSSSTKDKEREKDDKQPDKDKIAKKKKKKPKKSEDTAQDTSLKHGNAKKSIDSKTLICTPVQESTYSLEYVSLKGKEIKQYEKETDLNEYIDVVKNTNRIDNVKLEKQISTKKSCNIEKSNYLEQNENIPYRTYSDINNNNNNSNDDNINNKNNNNIYNNENHSHSNIEIQNKENYLSSNSGNLSNNYQIEAQSVQSNFNKKGKNKKKNQVPFLYETKVKQKKQQVENVVKDVKEVLIDNSYEYFQKRTYSNVTDRDKQIYSSSTINNINIGGSFSTKPQLNMKIIGSNLGNSNNSISPNQNSYFRFNKSCKQGNGIPYNQNYFINNFKSSNSPNNLNNPLSPNSSDNNNTKNLNNNNNTVTPKSMNSNNNNLDKPTKFFYNNGLFNLNNMSNTLNNLNSVSPKNQSFMQFPQNMPQMKGITPNFINFSNNNMNGNILFKNFNLMMHMQNMNQIKNLNNFNNNLPTFKSKFFEALDIGFNNYLEELNKTIKCVKPIKESIINHFKELSTENISTNMEINCYGSYVTEIEIENSDIDIRLNFLCNHIEFSKHLGELNYFLKQSNFFRNNQHIITAKIPVIKIVSCNLSKLYSFTLFTI